VDLLDHETLVCPFEIRRVGNSPIVRAVDTEKSDLVSHVRLFVMGLITVATAARELSPSVASPRRRDARRARFHSSSS
jgi:hypothetical protein